MSDKERMARKLAQIYGGPILIPYIQWVLAESNRLGIKKLFFVARDGYVLKIIADTLIQHKKMDIETSYIYGSRRVWRVSYLLQSDLDIIRFLEESYREKIINIHKLAAIFLISDEEVESFLPEYYGRHQNDLTAIDIFYIQNYLNTSKEFKEFLRKVHSERGERVKNYLLQEIGEGNERVAFVESVGTGYTQCGMELFLDRVDNVETFYYYQHNKKGKKAFYSYIKNENESSIMIELLCRACEGQTEDYYKKGQAYVPIFKDGEGEYLADYGYEAYLDEIRNITQQIGDKDIQQEKENWLRFSQMSDKEMLAYIGDFPYGVTGAERTVCRFAPKLTTMQIIHIILEGRRFVEQRYYSGALIDYSVLRSGNIIKKVIEISEKSRLFRDIKTRNLNKFERRGKVSIVEIFPEIRGKRVVIYGAGKIGTELVRDFLNNCNFELVLWIDQRPMENKLFSVSAPESIQKVDFDYVIIASLNWIFSNEMKKKLESLGIKYEKMVGWMEREET